MNIQTIYLTFAFLALLLPSCTPDGETDGNSLPDGKYPLIFTSSLEAMVETRATTDDEGSWTEGDQVAVKVGDEVKEYSYGADETFTSDKPFYWTGTDETKTVSAWYPYSAHTTENGIEWSVKSDQNADENYQQSDFLYAPEQDIEFNDKTKSLDFYHQTARVVINIKKAEVATKENDIKSVVIGDANNFSLWGTYTAPSGDVTAGTWNTSSSSAMGTIIPKDITDPTTGFLKTYTALVIPQDMDGKPFIKVTIGEDDAAREYVYTPEEDKADLKAGNQYTYNITVKKTGLEVTAGTSVSWNEASISVSPNDNFAYQITAPTGVTIAAASGGTLSGNNGSYTLSDGNEITVTVNGRSDKFLKGLSAEGIYDRSVDYKSGTYTYTYKLKSDILLSEPVFVDTTEPEVGNFYYFDGTWSADLWDKPCVGIVFKVGVGEDDNINNYSGSGLTGEINGYAVALNTLTGSRQGWGSISSVTINTDNEKFYGYRNTQTIKSASGYGESDFWACYHAANHTPAAPANSSGWYLPSLGEYNVLWQVYGSIQSLFASAGGTDMKISLGFYWTSSTTSSSAACVDFGAWSATGSFTSAIRIDNAYVRPVLTF
ncbi:fimbrillin family protein [Parabacteroides sp.]